VKINVETSGEFLKGVETFFHEYKDVFTWGYQDMKGIPPSICEHQIDLEERATPSHQQWYRMNPNYTSKVWEDLDLLLDVGFITPIGLMKWLSPIVIVPKKNGKLRICVD
jgi:hypothetical protein